MEMQTNGKGPRTFHEKLPVSLTLDELVARGAEAAEASAEAAKLEAERKNTNDGYKARIELAEARVRDLLQVIGSKLEPREVELVEEFVFATNTVLVKRADTGEKVRERAMTKAERQAELPLEAPGHEKKNGSADGAKAKHVDANGTDITDPQAVLGPDAPSPKRGRKSKRAPS